MRTVLEDSANPNTLSTSVLGLAADFLATIVDRRDAVASIRLFGALQWPLTQL